MQIKKYNISKPKKYIDKQNQEKTQWNNIGTITEFYKDDGSISRIIEIPAIGLNASIFPIEDTSEVKKEVETESSTKTSPSEDFPEGLNPQDIPF